MSSVQDIVQGSTFANVSMCALVLEDNPVGDDSRLDFESFPENGIEEAYSTTAYREIAADRMSQPGFAAYRGGNWSSFNLELEFRAGNALGRPIASLGELSTTDLEDILLQMERKGRWCQALPLPLERQATEFADRIKQNALAGGFSESDLQAVNLGQLTRNDPPMVLIVFGSFMVIRAYCTGVDLKWTAPFHPITVQPYGVVATMTFQRLDKGYPDWKSVRNSAGGGATPFLPRLPGSALLRSAAASISASNVAQANALATAQARGLNADTSAAPAASLSVGRG